MACAPQCYASLCMHPQFNTEYPRDFGNAQHPVASSYESFVHPPTCDVVLENILFWHLNCFVVTKLVLLSMRSFTSRIVTAGMHFGSELTLIASRKTDPAVQNHLVPPTLTLGCLRYKVSMWLCFWEYSHDIAQALSSTIEIILAVCNSKTEMHGKVARWFTTSGH